MLRHVLPTHLPTYLRRYTIFSGMFWFLFPASLVVGNDCFAYIAGQIAGKKIFGNVRRLPSLPPLRPLRRGRYRLGGLSRDRGVYRVVCPLVARVRVCLFVCLVGCCICGTCSECSSSCRPTRRGKGLSADSCSRISTRLSLRQCGAPPHSRPPALHVGSPVSTRVGHICAGTRSGQCGFRVKLGGHATSSPGLAWDSRSLGTQRVLEARIVGCMLHRPLHPSLYVAPCTVGSLPQVQPPVLPLLFPRAQRAQAHRVRTLRPQTAIRAQPTRAQLKRTRAIQSAPRVSLCSDGTYSIVAQVPQSEYPKVLCPQVRQRLADLHAVVQRLQLPADPGVSLQHAARTFVSLQHAARTFVSLQHAAHTFVSLQHASAHACVATTCSAHVCVATTCSAHVPAPAARSRTPRARCRSGRCTIRSACAAGVHIGPAAFLHVGGSRCFTAARS